MLGNIEGDDILFEDEFDEFLFNYDRIFPDELLDENGESLIYDFYQTRFKVIKSELNPEIRKLMFAQYPEMETETRPLVVREIEKIISATGTLFLIDLFCLLYKEQNGINLREAYPKIEMWRTLYAIPSKTYGVGENDFPNMPWLTEEEKQEIIEMNKNEYFYLVNRKERRRKEFINVLQSVILKHYTQLASLSPEGWIVYAAQINYEYGRFKDDADLLTTFIQLNLPEEDLMLNYLDIYDKIEEAKAEKFRRPEEPNN